MTRLRIYAYELPSSVAFDYDKFVGWQGEAVMCNGQMAHEHYYRFQQRYKLVIVTWNICVSLQSTELAHIAMYEGDDGVPCNADVQAYPCLLACPTQHLLDNCHGDSVIWHACCVQVMLLTTWHSGASWLAFTMTGPTGIWCTMFFGCSLPLLSLTSSIPSTPNLVDWLECMSCLSHDYQSLSGID